MRVAVATDHAGVGLLETTIDVIDAAGHEALVIGQATDGDDYPDVALAVGGAIRTGRAQRGVVLCGSGAGVTVAANKIPLVRAALAYDTYTARQMVQHDDVNVLALGARVIGPAVAADVVGAFLGARFSGAARHARRLSKVLAIEATRVQGAAADLVERGQRVWLDGVDATLLDDGRVAHWVGDRAVSGAVTSPARLAAGLRTGAYHAQLAGRYDGGVDDPEALALALLLADACAAADLLRGLHAASGGHDGYASLDLPARLADDVDGTLEVAQRLHRLADRPNLMIKVPSTRAGHTVVRRLVEAGIGVHVTLVYSVEQYRAAQQAYLDGVALRVRAGDDPAVGGIIAAHVAPWDDATVDRLPETLQHTVGVYAARRIIDASRDGWADAQWQSLADAGALPHQVALAGLEASAPLRPTHYLDALDADGLTLLLTPSTIAALDPAGDLGGSDQTTVADPDALAEAGISLDALATRLQHDGLRRAAAGWDEALDIVIDAARDAVDAPGADSGAVGEDTAASSAPGGGN